MSILYSIVTENIYNQTNKEFYNAFSDQLLQYILILQPNNSPISTKGGKTSSKIQESKILGLVRLAKFEQLYLVFVDIEKSGSKIGALFKQLKSLDKRRAIRLKDTIIRYLNQWLEGHSNINSVSNDERGIDQETQSSSRVSPSSGSTSSPVLIQRPPGPVPPTAEWLRDLWIKKRSKGINYLDRASYEDCYVVSKRMAKLAGAPKFKSEFLYHKGSHHYPTKQLVIEAFSRGWGKKFKARWYDESKKNEIQRGHPRFDHIVKFGSTHYFKIYKGEYTKNESDQEFQLVELRPGMLIYTAGEVGGSKKGGTGYKWNLRHMVTYYKDGLVLENFRNPKGKLRRLMDLKNNWKEISPWTDYNRKDNRARSKNEKNWHMPHKSIVSGKKKKTEQFCVVVSIEDPYYSGRYPKPKVLGPFNK